MPATSPPQNVLRSGELAKASGLSTDTLRHYERKGVLPPVRRLSNGYRVYPPDSVERLRLIQRALAVGFTLDELAKFLKARDRGQAPCQEVRALAAEKLTEIESRLRELLQVRDELRATITEWDSRLMNKNPGERSNLLQVFAEQGGVRAEGKASVHQNNLSKKDK